MAETRLIQKQLAGVEDLLLGIGTATQTRATGPKTITKINADQLQGALVVDTIDELLALNPTLLVKGTCIVKDEDRGGVFVYQETNALVNNGGTIFNGWTRQYDGAVNVKWFGAKGDGVTDDTIPIKNTVLTGEDIKIPQGVFKITDKITGFANNQNIFVFGELKPTVSLFMVIDGVSNVSILSFGGGINIPAGVANNKIDFGNGIHIKNSSKIKIVGFKVTGQESDREKTAFVTGSNSSVNCIIKENEIINIGTSCWIGWTDTTSNQDSNNIPTSQWLVENNIFNNCGTSVASSIAVRSKDNAYDRANPYAKTSHTIKNNNILNFAQGCGIEYWSNGGLIDGNKIIGNNPDSYTGIGISLAKSYDTKAINNNISGVLGYQGIELATCNNCVVTANTIYGITSDNANSAGVGISVAQINDPSPTANIISNNSFIACKRGVILGGAGTGLTTGTIISNNSFDSATDYGVYIASGTKITTIEKNDFNSCVQGIYSISGLTDGSSYIDIINNTFRNTTGQVLYNENASGSGRPFRFMNNYVHGWGTATKPQAIMARCAQSEIIGNSFVDDGRDKAGFPGSYAYCVNRSYAYGAVRHIVRENKIQGVAKLSISAISGDIAPINANNADGYWNNYSIHSYRNSNSDTAIGNVRIMDMANAPTAQSWLAGDVVYNSNPTAGGYTGWICTVSGTPGTWKGFGLIQA